MSRNGSGRARGRGRRRWIVPALFDYEQEPAVRRPRRVLDVLRAVESCRPAAAAAPSGSDPARRRDPPPRSTAIRPSSAAARPRTAPARTEPPPARPPAYCADRPRGRFSTNGGGGPDASARRPALTARWVAGRCPVSRACASSPRSNRSPRSDSRSAARGEILDRLAAGIKREVVDDQKTANREPVIEVDEPDPWSTRTCRRRGGPAPRCWCAASGSVSRNQPSTKRTLSSSSP